MEGYEIIYYPEFGRELAIRTDTGEVSETVNITIPAGSTITTPRQWEKYEQRKKREEQRIFRRSEIQYYWANSYERFELKPETITRLFYIMSFATHKERGARIMLNNKTQMKKRDLPKVLDCSQPTANKFFSEVSPDYIFETEEGLFWKDNVWLHRGGGLIMSEDKFYIRIFCECIQKLYRCTRGKNAKYVGYVFTLLPYVNREFNILCFNPKEADAEKIKPMDFSDVCRLTGFDAHNGKRLFTALDNLSFMIDGKEQWFFRLLHQPHTIDYASANIYINPRLMYSGTSREKIEHLFIP